MSLNLLTPAEQQTVFECLLAASDGPFFPDWEFETLMGLPRERVREIGRAAPNINDSSKDVALAINNSMNNLLGYPHRQKAAWSEFISVSETEVDRVFNKWRNEPAS